MRPQPRTIAAVQATPTDFFRRPLERLRRASLVVSDLLVKLVPRRSRDLALIVRLDGIGDFALWLQCGAAEVTEYARVRHGKVVLVANAAWAALATDIGLWDEVFAIDVRRFETGFAYRFRTMLAIRRSGSSMLVQPRSFRSFLIDDQIALCGGATKRIGQASPPVNNSAFLLSIGNRWYTTLLGAPGPKAIHQLHRNRFFFEALGQAPQPPVRPDFSGVAPCFAPSRRYAVLAMGAGWSGKCWPIENFAAVARELERRFGLKIVLVGGSGDSAAAAALRALRSGDADDLTGRLSLLETTYVISRAAIVISNDSAAMHLAAWVGTAVVTVVGGGHFSLFAPYPTDIATPAPVLTAHLPMACYGCNWDCVYDIGDGPTPCVRDVRVDVVLTMAHSILQSGAA